MIITKLRGAGEGELDKVTTGVKTHRRKQEKYVEGCKRKPREKRSGHRAKASQPHRTDKDEETPQPETMPG